MDAESRERLAVIEERTRCLPILAERLQQHDVDIAVLKERVKPRKGVTWKIGLGALLVSVAAALREALK